MAGLCEGGNEPPGSLKSSNFKKELDFKLKLEAICARSTDVGRWKTAPQQDIRRDSFQLAVKQILHPRPVRIDPTCAIVTHPSQPSDWSALV
ncbi:hypothetical protein ANN_12174 [Periplaneta americana]|uniref:Uncharacterized protein n=1 Tax=Periplaneta americana TaxID=6978 RepID=A0ABQ8T8L9_PERAM|nr:hypothetical protein ANN_12174 [Periplaneta americana]